jgi:hypothetical protein
MVGDKRDAGVMELCRGDNGMYVVGDRVWMCWKELSRRWW